MTREKRENKVTICLNSVVVNLVVWLLGSELEYKKMQKMRQDTLMQGPKFLPGGGELYFVRDDPGKYEI